MITDSEDSSDSGQSASVVELDEETQKLVAALANRAYHLPGNGYWEDLCQYLNNNHPILGIFFRNRLHPIRTGLRLLILLSSVLFGLIVSNIFFLLVLNNEQFQRHLFAISVNGEEWFITSGMLMLITIGGSVHATYDLWIWYILSCGCCPFNEKWKRYGSFLAVACILLLLAISSLIVLVRASLQQDENEGLDIYELDSGGLADDQIVLKDIHKEDVRFLLGYVTELALALLVYYPIGSFILFSGLLGFGTLPILGGRPRDIELEERHRQKRPFDTKRQQDISSQMKSIFPDIEM